MQTPNEENTSTDSSKNTDSMLKAEQAINAIAAIVQDLADEGHDDVRVTAAVTVDGEEGAFSLTTEETHGALLEALRHTKESGFMQIAQDSNIIVGEA